MKIQMRTFYGGTDGFDYVCIDKTGKITCSGKKYRMLELARKYNYAVAMLRPVRFAKAIATNPEAEERK